MRQQYSPTLKAQVVLEMLQETRPVTEIAAEYGIAPRPLHRWRGEVVEHLPDLFAEPATVKRSAAVQDAKVEELYAHVGKLTTQLAWLKKSGLDLSPEARRVLVDRCGKGVAADRASRPVVD